MLMVVSEGISASPTAWFVISPLKMLRSLMGNVGSKRLKDCSKFVLLLAKQQRRRLCGDDLHVSISLDVIFSYHPIRRSASSVTDSYVKSQSYALS